MTPQQRDTLKRRQGIITQLESLGDDPRLEFLADDLWQELREIEDDMRRNGSGQTITGTIDADVGKLVFGPGRF